MLLLVAPKDSARMLAHRQPCISIKALRWLQKRLPLNYSILLIDSYQSLYCYMDPLNEFKHNTKRVMLEPFPEDNHCKYFHGSCSSDQRSAAADCIRLVR